jgi:hypothetical protein
MLKCAECSEKIGLLQGYNHPTLGKRYILCDSCYLKISGSLEKWKNFIIVNSFKKNLEKNHFYGFLNNVNFRCNMIKKKSFFKY